MTPLNSIEHAEVEFNKLADEIREKFYAWIYQTTPVSEEEHMIILDQFNSLFSTVSDQLKIWVKRGTPVSEEEQKCIVHMFIELFSCCDFNIVYLDKLEKIPDKFNKFCNIQADFLYCTYEMVLKDFNP